MINRFFQYDFINFLSIVFARIHRHLPLSPLRKRKTCFRNPLSFPFLPFPSVGDLSDTPVTFRLPPYCPLLLVPPAPSQVAPACCRDACYYSRSRSDCSLSRHCRLSPRHPPLSPMFLPAVAPLGAVSRLCVARCLFRHCCSSSVATPLPAAALRRRQFHRRAAARYCFNSCRIRHHYTVCCCDRRRHSACCCSIFQRL